MPIESSSWATIPDFLEAVDSETANCFHRTKWDQLCRIASDLAGAECVALDHLANGLNNMVRLLQFADKTRWAARVHITRSGYHSTKSRLQSEIATMQFIKKNSDLPVAEVFAYELDEDNPVGAPFILMELLPGSVAMDTMGGYAVHRGIFPTECLESLCRSVAKCQAQMTSLRLPQIGSIIRNREGKYECGPIPGLGGPFDTATEYFEAWAETVKFKRDKPTIISMMKGTPISGEDMHRMIEKFPSQIKALASQLSVHDKGPFPLIHVDFYHSNIMVDEKFNVTGVIDWEGAQTAPWELVAFPSFLNALPVSFDLPHKYDQDGQPLGKELQEDWRRRAEYVEMVKSAENDTLLSACLGSKRSQTIAYVLEAYDDIGKMGTYDRVIEELGGTT